MKRLRHVGDPQRFPARQFDRSRWPGRELYWAWRHPALTLLLAFGSIGEIATILGSLL